MSQICLNWQKFLLYLKKLDRLFKENYRPVSILTAISKVFEPVFGNQLSTFFDQIFLKFLSGLRQRYSWQTSLLQMIEVWKSELDNGNIIGTVAIDLSKAFDSLPHALLIAKLHAYGVDLSSCKLLASYLHNRYQRVKIKDIRSDWLITDRGVPQDSILGPLLFNVFINDMFFLNNDINIYNFADDNCISYAEKMYCKSKVFWKRRLTKWWTGSRKIHSQPTLPNFRLCSCVEMIRKWTIWISLLKIPSWNQHLVLKYLVLTLIPNWISIIIYVICAPRPDGNWMCCKDWKGR